MSANTRDVLICAAALLEQGRIVDRLSRLLTAAALVSLAVLWFFRIEASVEILGFATLVALAGLAETCLAIRVGFDAALFDHQARAAETPDFTRMDAALVELGLLPAAKTGRPVSARVAGARRLFVLQIIALIAQVGLAVAGGWLRLPAR